MPLNLEDKKVLVAEVAEVAKTALSVVAAENSGLTVSQMTDLRSKARASGVPASCSRLRQCSRGPVTGDTPSSRPAG